MRQITTPPTSESGPGLLRALGLLTAMSVVVGNVIGSGIFYKPGKIAAECGNFPLIIAIWLVGGLLCMLGALCLSELATMLPRAGGFYVYLKEAYGNFVAFLFGWTQALFSRPSSIGALAVVFVGSFAKAIGWSPTVWQSVLLASLLIAGLAWVNVMGVVWGGRVQLAVTSAKVLFLALVALTPFLVHLGTGSTVSAANYATRFTPKETAISVQIGAVLLAVMWAYNGWHAIGPLAEEVREPQRNIPWALIGGVGLIITLYIAANFAYHATMTMEEMAKAGDHAAENMLLKIAGPFGLRGMAVVILCSTFGAINTVLLQGPRVAYAMGRDGTFFRALGRAHSDYRTPAASILLMATMAIGLVAAAGLAKYLAADAQPDAIRWELARKIVESAQKDSIFSMLTNFAIFSMSIFYMLGVLAVVVLRVRHPEWERPYRTWGYPVVPLLFVAVYIWFLVQIYRGSPLESRVGLVLIAMGIPVYLFFRVTSNKEGS